MKDDKIIKVASWIIVGSVVIPIGLGIIGSAVTGVSHLIQKLNNNDNNDNNDNKVINYEEAYRRYSNDKIKKK